MQNSSHVIHDRHNEALQCVHCQYRRSVPYWATRNPDYFLDFKQEFADEHKGCVEYAHNPHLAAINFKAKLALKLAALRKKNLRYKPATAVA